MDGDFFLLNRMSYEDPLPYRSSVSRATILDDIYGNLDLGRNNIRLVRVIPDDGSGQVRCLMSHFNLDEWPQYTALSYMWGLPPAENAITLNRHHFNVRKNLWRFLQQAARTERLTSELFWIDAICINQSDLRERTHQVKIMAQIYSRAAQVVVWLGPTYNDSDIAMDHLARPSSYWKGKRPLSIWSKPAGRAINGLCSRTYWTRMWIFQEIVLARDIKLMCGSKVNSWATFSTFLNKISGMTPNPRMETRDSFAAVRASSAVPIVLQTAHDTSGRNLWDLILITRRLVCADVRDKVYALLGVATGGQTDISPDYSIPISTLLNTVLKEQHKIQHPANVQQVLSQCQLLASIVGLELGIFFSLDGQRGKIPIAAANEFAKIAPRSTRCPLTLCWAHFYGHSKVAELLLSEGHYDVDELLSTAAETGSTRVVQALVPCLSLVTRQGTDKALCSAIDNEHKVLLELLLEARMGPEMRKCDAQKAVRHAIATKSSVTILELLLNTDRFDVNLQDPHGITALHDAVLSRSLQVVLHLLRLNDVDINLKDFAGHTPLSIAVMNRSTGMIKALLERRYIDAGVKYGRECALCSLDLNSKMLAPLLREEQVDIIRFIAEDDLQALAISLDMPWVHVNGDHLLGSPIYFAMKRSNKDAFALFLTAARVDVNFQDQRGLSITHHAILTEELEALALILDTPRIDVNIKDARGFTPIHYAVDGNSMEALTLLLGSSRVDVNIKDAYGFSPLHYAVRWKHLETTTLLLDSSRVDVNIKDAGGFSPLHYAIGRNSMEAITLLLGSSRVDINIKNAHGFTPLDHAIQASIGKADT